MVARVTCFWLLQQEDKGNENEDREQDREAVFEDVPEEGRHRHT